MRIQEYLIEMLQSLYEGRDNGECNEYERFDEKMAKDFVEFFKQNYKFFEVGDEFIFIGDKSRFTKGKIYKIYQKISHEDYNDEFWCYNDRNQPGIVYPDDMKIKQ